MKSLTYKTAGVDIDKANILAKKISGMAKKTKRPACVMPDIGAFGSFYKLDTKLYRQPVLVSSSDGVGTKLKIAKLANKHDTVGIDLVAMNVNDILATGARPLFFLDYISTGKLKAHTYLDVIKGIVAGCSLAGCALIGGETAEMPGMYKEDEYDLAGFCVGIVEKNRIINGRNIKAGDVIIGIASSGLHSNGFSLVRKVFSQKEQKKMAKILLTPTRIYVKPILSLLRNTPWPTSRKHQGRQYARVRSEAKPPRRGHNTIKGIAHVTGGAFYEKVPKMIPKGLCALIRKDSWQVPAIFTLVQKKGNVPQKDMYKTFNMGIGMVLFADKKDAKKIQAGLAKFKLRSWVIGEVVKGKETVIV